MSQRPQLDTLAIAAHPDDVEITCGGLLIKLSDMGRATGVLDLTKGEMGTKGSEDDRRSEADAAGKIMGLTWRGNADLPDAALELSQEFKLRVAQVIRDTCPELVILPHWEQRHPDHRIASQLGYDACFLAGLKKASLRGAPHRPRKILYVSYLRNQTHSFLVDISDVFQRKCEAVAAYASQFEYSEKVLAAMREGRMLHDLVEEGKDVFHPGLNIFDLMQARNRTLGQLVGVTYAEAYTVIEHMLVDDPQKMPVNSI